ncbi:hypothetical protein EJ07DRAFT_158151 [Lizonia empirigonia]|nr:hypothetical protein EJ07DRAFT_158151 [Lizonia empirigonia]
MDASTTSIVSSTSTSSSLLKSALPAPKQRRSRKLHFHWPQKPRFVRLPKDKHQLDAQPISFFHGGSASGAKPLSGRALGEREREERVEKRECDVRLRENRAWEGLKEVARGKVAVAVLEARVRELEESRHCRRLFTAARTRLTILTPNAS